MSLLKDARLSRIQSRYCFRKRIGFSLLRYLHFSVEKRLKRTLYFLPCSSLSNIFSQTPYFLGFLIFSLNFVGESFLILLTLFFQILQMNLFFLYLSLSIQYLLFTKTMHLLLLFLFKLFYDIFFLFFSPIQLIVTFLLLLKTLFSKLLNFSQITKTFLPNLIMNFKFLLSHHSLGLS
jgi:hypothetical protein